MVNSLELGAFLEDWGIDVNRKRRGVYRIDLGVISTP